MQIIPGNELNVKWYCGTWAYFNAHTGQFKPFLCGQATCGRVECRRAFKRARIALIADLIEEYQLTRFFTLTLDRSLKMDDAWERIPYIWDKFRRVISRKYPGFLYCAVLEAHKDGYPHIHGFTNTYLRTEEYAHHWQACGGGKICWVERIKQTGDIASYVGKQISQYIGKDSLTSAKLKSKPRARTFWRSSKMKTKAESDLTSSGEWSIIKERVFSENELTIEWRLISHGIKEECEGKEMDRTCGTVFEPCSDTGVQDMEA
jgi:hypothetical protein